MTETKLAALLGRPLTALETTNYKLYLDIASERLQELLCFPLTEVTETRYFSAREGYSTVFVGAIQSVSEVKLNGSISTDYTPYLWDSRNSQWFNSLVFNEKFDANDEVEITGDWGFCPIPNDLGQLLAKLFNLVSSGAAADSNIASKQVEDFRVTFKGATSTTEDLSDEERLIEANAQTINKYSLCNIGQVRNGAVCDEPYRI